MRTQKQKRLEQLAKRNKKNPYKNRKHIKLQEKNFVKNAWDKAKNFIKTTAKDVQKSAKKFIKDMKKEYMGGKNRDNFKPGKMIAMNYKAKDATQKYDKNPLVISLGPSQNKKLSKTHFIGLNLHWMPMNDRIAVASFFAELNEKRDGKLVYDDVKPFIQKFKGHQVLRMYIIDRVGNKVIEMPTDVFMSAAAVPSEIWAGGN